MIIDLNVRPEGDVDVDAFVAKAQALGLDGFLLNHSADADTDFAALKSGATDAGLKVFEGVLAETNQGLILCVGNDGSLSLKDAPREEGVLEASGVIDAVEQTGGVTIAVRPYDRNLERPMGDHLFALQGLTACEVQNGSASATANDLALEAASNMEMPCVGGSDATASEGLGGAATIIRTPCESQADLVEALKKGACWPVTFSDRAPRGERRERDGERGGRGRGRRGGRDDRGGNGDGRRRSRRGGGGGGRGRGGRGDDFGNRQGGGGNRRPVAEDAGNRAAPAKAERSVDDDIGNRLAPGESNPYNFNE